MSLAIVHFALGATGGILLAKTVRASLPFILIVMMGSGIWAIMPDVCQLGVIDCKSTHIPYLSDVFWFHGTLDLIDAENPLMALPFILLWILAIAMVSFGETTV